MGIIYQTDKRAGITYAYENKAYWDKEKKQSRSTRKLIGRVDPDTGEIVPTAGRRKHPDYKKLYEDSQEKCMELETLIITLQKEVKELKKRNRK